MPSTRSTTSSVYTDDDTQAPGPLACCDGLARTAAETCRQHERLSKLMALGVGKAELAAALAMVDTIDLALAEAVAEFEKKAAKATVSEQPDVRAAANAMWLSAREYLRRHSFAEKASRQLSQNGDTFGDLHLDYELEASALLGLKQSTAAYQKLRPDTRA